MSLASSAPTTGKRHNPVGEGSVGDDGPGLGSSSLVPVFASHGLVGLTASEDDDIRRQQERMNRRAFTYLSASQIKWVGKRKPSAASNTKAFIPPSRVLQLRQIFKGLDFDGSGEISLDELKDAVVYVSKSNTGTGPPLIKDPEGIGKLFESMDIDGNGVVDFEEFLLGMTNPASGESSALKNVSALQQAFYDFANQHRRQMIIDKMKDNSVSVTDRYAEFHKLYTIKFLKEETTGAITTDDMIRQAQKEADDEKGEMAVASRVSRAREVMRSRAAAIDYDERLKMLNPPRDGPYPAALRGYIGSTVPPIVNKGAGVYKSLMKLGISKSLEAFKKERLEKAVSDVVVKTVAARMAKFPLPTDVTHMPPLTLQRSASALSLQASREVMQIRSGPADRTKDMLRAPVSMRQQMVERAKASQFEVEREHHKRHHHHHHH